MFIKLFYWFLPTKRKGDKNNEEQKRKLFVFCLAFLITLTPIQAASTSTILTTAATVIWKLVQREGQILFNRVPTIVYGPNWVRSNTGSVSLANGYVATASVNMPKSNLRLELWGQTDVTHMFTDAIEIRLNNPNGAIAANKKMDHNQRLGYVPNVYGTYKLQYSDVDGLKWDCYFTLYDFNNARSTSIALDESGNIIGNVYRSDNGKNYIIPSKEHVSNIRNLKDSITFEELRKQTYDDSNNTYVYDYKDYKIGDKIIIKDIIKEISYDESMDATLFSFDFDDNKIIWYFKGNHTLQYSKGDTISLEVKVVEEIDGNSDFENLDILKETKRTNDAPNLGEYLFDAYNN